MKSAKFFTQLEIFWAVKILTGRQPENVQKSVKSIELIADNSLVWAIGSPIGWSLIHNLFIAFLSLM